MANNLGVNYTKEWSDEPSQKAAKATRNAALKYFVDDFSAVADTNKCYICKLEGVSGIFLGIDALVGTKGAGAAQAIDKDGNVTALAVGDTVDGKVDGGLIIAQVADATSSATLMLAAKFLLD